MSWNLVLIDRGALKKGFLWNALSCFSGCLECHVMFWSPVFFDRESAWYIYIYMFPYRNSMCHSRPCPFIYVYIGRVCPISGSGSTIPACRCLNRRWCVRWVSRLAAGSKGRKTRFKRVWLLWVMTMSKCNVMMVKCMMSLPWPF